MTKEEFINEHSLIQEKLKGIKQELEDLKNRYIAEYPFKVGDKVEYEGKEYFIGMFKTYLRDIPQPYLVKPKKDGTISKTSACIWNDFKAEDLKLIERK